MYITAWVTETASPSIADSPPKMAATTSAGPVDCRSREVRSHLLYEWQGPRYSRSVLLTLPQAASERSSQDSLVLHGTPNASIAKPQHRSPALALLPQCWPQHPLLLFMQVRLASPLVKIIVFLHLLENKLLNGSFWCYAHELIITVCP